MPTALLQHRIAPILFAVLYSRRFVYHVAYHSAICRRPKCHKGTIATRHAAKAHLDIPQQHDRFINISGHPDCGTVFEVQVLPLLPTYRDL